MKISTLGAKVFFQPATNQNDILPIHFALYDKYSPLFRGPWFESRSGFMGQSM